MSIEPITIPMTMSASEVDIPMDFETEINVHSGGGSNLQAKTNISPTTSSQTITADVGYDGLSSVQINAMPSGSATTPATSITANPTISVNSSTGVITASVSKTQSVTPTVSAGYVASGTSGIITVSGGMTSSLTTQGAQTIHPSSSDQTIASGKYLTGAQTIKGVTTTNLTAENIKKDVVIEIGDSTDSDCVTSVIGSYEGGGGGISIGGLISCSEPIGNIYTDSAVEVKAQALRGRTNITGIDFPNVTAVREYGFLGCTGLLSANLPSVTQLDGHAFDGCTQLASFTAKNAKRIFGQAFVNVISDLAFPNITTEFGNEALRNYKGAKVDLGGSALAIKTSAFYNATNLSVIVLRNTSLVSMTANNSFSGTPFASGGTGGTIYIPKVLYDHLGDNSSSDYKHATNWSTVDGYGTITWAKIEGSQYENYYADGTPISS